MAKREKRLSLPPSGQDAKEVRITPQSAIAMRPLWAFRLLDLRSHWCWSNMSEEVLLDVMSHLRDFESMAWAEIERAGSHFVATTDLIKKAQERLVEIGQDDVDTLFSLRIGGKSRIWGIRDGHVLRVLWWDPQHEVCPSYKKPYLTTGCITASARLTLYVVGKYKEREGTP